MKCKKCNSTVDKNSKFCKKCGEPIESSKIKKNIIIILSVILAIAVIVVLLLKFFAEKKPNVEKVEEDVKDNILIPLNEEVEISEFSIDSEQPEKKNYSAQISVVFSYDDVEYSQEYTVDYYKAKEWTYVGYEEYDTETWEVKPLKAPTAEDVKEQNWKVVSDDSGYIVDIEVPTQYRYDSMTVSEEQEEPNLEEGTANYYYDAVENSTFRSVDGKLKFEYVFDPQSAKWKLDGGSAVYENATLNILSSWGGIGTVSGSYGDDDMWKADFDFTITSVDGENIKAVITKDEETYNLSGTINPTNLVMELYGENDDSIYLKGSLDEETSAFRGSFYTSYDPDAIFYWTAERSVYDMELSKKN